MVRGYDPVSSDLSTMMWNYLFSFWTNDNKIDLTQSSKLVNYWLKNSQETSSVYNKFSRLQIRPTIKLKKRCDPSSFQSQSSHLKQDGRHFPAASTNNQIIICLNHVENKLQLKQNIDRELNYLLLRHNRDVNKLSHEDQERFLMKDLYESCYSGYKNYKLSDEVTKEMSIVCSKYLFFRKSTNTLPIDRRFRYTTQLADQLLI